MKYVIVRSHTAGVHAGELVSRNGDEVVLANSRRLWRWYGASLSQVAAQGPASGDNRFGMTLPSVTIISPQGFEIAECTPAGETGIKAVPDWVV